jgi:sulfur-oxidizing protein SoxX
MKGVLVASVAVALAAGTTVAETKKVDYTQMSPEALAEHLIFEAKGFKLDQPTQEGGTVRDRLTQDEIQMACSGAGRAGLDGEATQRIISLARESLVKPEGGVKLGDWKAGEEVARSGFGFRVGHRTDDHSNREPGGNCYACHQLDPKEISYGTLGPSLTGYGKARGTSQAILDYTYEVVYSPHAYFPCTHMPRFGANGVLTEQQISDVLAYLLDPESPVNQ